MLCPEPALQGAERPAGRPELQQQRGTAADLHLLIEGDDAFVVLDEKDARDSWINHGPQPTRNTPGDDGGTVP